MLGKAREEPLQIMASELPGEGSGRLLVTLLEGDEAFGQSVEVGEVVGGQNLALNHREVDLDLVEPGGMSGKVDEHQIGPGALKALHRSLTPMRGAVVHYPEHPLGGGVGFLSHHLLDQRAEGLDAVLRLATTEKLRPVHVPGGHVGQSPASFVAVLHAHRPAFTRGLGPMAAAAGLDGGLFVGRDHVLPLSERLAFPPTLVEVQHPGGFLGEVGVPREDPRAVVEGPDGVLTEPSPDGGPRDLARDETPLHRLARHFPGTPAAQGNPAGCRQLTSEGLHLHPRFGGKREALCPSVVDPPVRPTPPRRSACATYRPSGAWCPAPVRSPCWRFPLRPAALSWRVPPPSRERCGRGLVRGGWRAALWSARCGKGFGWASLLPSLEGAMFTKILSREENASRKFRQRPLRARRLFADPPTGYC